MEIICSTTYDRRALSALARALRKTVRRTRSRLLRVWCWVLLVLSLLSAWVSWGEWGTVALNGAVAVLMLAVLLGEDAINAFFARRNALPGMEVCTVRFLEEHYETKIAGAATQWQYIASSSGWRRMTVTWCSFWERTTASSATRRS